MLKKKLWWSISSEAGLFVYHFHSSFSKKTSMMVKRLWWSISSLPFPLLIFKKHQWWSRNEAAFKTGLFVQASSSHLWNLSSSHVFKYIHHLITIYNKIWSHFIISSQFDQTLNTFFIWSHFIIRFDHTLRYIHHLVSQNNIIWSHFITQTYFSLGPTIINVIIITIINILQAWRLSVASYSVESRL